MLIVGTILIIGSVGAFALVLCKAAGDADKRMENLIRERDGNADKEETARVESGY